MNALRKTSNADTRNLPMNFVYNHPTIASLAPYVARISDPESSISGSDLSTAKTDEMQSMLAKYSSNFSQRIASASAATASHVILLTGTTGGLGSVLLNKLLDSPDVSRVYAVNRKGAGTVYARQELAFSERALEVKLLSSPKLVLLEGNISGEQLGLEKSVYEEVGSSPSIGIPVNIDSFTLYITD